MMKMTEILNQPSIIISGRGEKAAPPTKHAVQSASSVQLWRIEKEADPIPASPWFKSHRMLGAQIDASVQYFFKSMVQTLCSNTNKKAAMNLSMKKKKYSWTPVSVEEFYQFTGMLFFMARLLLHHLQDYWRQDHIFSILFQAKVIDLGPYHGMSTKETLNRTL